jgi:molybdopterin synthase sulfur carrier subunit
MPRVFFTAHLRKHQPCQPAEVGGETVAQVLGAVFHEQPELRSYLLDDQGRVRQHVMIFVDDAPLADRDRLSDPLTPSSEIYVMQALSGG